MKFCVLQHETGKVLGIKLENEQRYSSYSYANARLAPILLPLDYFLNNNNNYRLTIFENKKAAETYLQFLSTSSTDLYNILLLSDLEIKNE